MSPRMAYVRGTGSAGTRFAIANRSDQSLRVFLAILSLSNTIHIPATYSHIVALCTTLRRCEFIAPARNTLACSLAHSPIFALVQLCTAASSNNITTYTIHQSLATLSVASAPVNNDIFAKTPKGFIIPESPPPRKSPASETSPAVLLLLRISLLITTRTDDNVAALLLPHQPLRYSWAAGAAGQRETPTLATRVVGLGHPPKQSPKNRLSGAQSNRTGWRALFVRVSLWRGELKKQKIIIIIPLPLLLRNIPSPRHIHGPSE